MVVMPEVMTPEMERVWRDAWVNQAYRRRGSGPVGNTRRIKNPESCEQFAYRALRKHIAETQGAAAPSVQERRAGE